MLGHALVGEPRLCAALATAVARWRPQSSLGRRGEGRRDTARGEVGPEAAEMPREAEGEAGGSLRPPSAAGGGAEAERERGGRKSFDLFAKSKNFRGPTGNQK